MKKIMLLLCVLLLFAVPAHALTITATLSWGDVAGEDTYLVERANVSGGPYAQIGTTNANVTTFADAGLSMATQYCYRVKSANAYGQSAPSNEACAMTGTTPPPPGGVSVTITVVP